MFRETLQYVACLSIVTSVFSLHVFERNSPASQFIGIDTTLLHKNKNESPTIGAAMAAAAAAAAASGDDGGGGGGVGIGIGGLQSPSLALQHSAGTNNNNINNNEEVSDLPMPILREPAGPNTNTLLHQYNRSPSQSSSSITSKIYSNIIQLDDNMSNSNSNSNNKLPRHRIYFSPYQPSKKRAVTSDAPDPSYSDRNSMKYNSKMLPTVPHGIASQLMLRSARGQRQYDVPQIECPPAMDGMERFACPSPDRQGRYRCIDDHVLCDGFIDCPEGEDEDRQACMFYKTTKAHLDVLADALLRWARGR